MGFGFNNSEHTSSASATLDVLRGQAFQRLDDVQKRLESKGMISAMFGKHAAASNNSNDMGFIGSLVFNMLICGGLASMSPFHVGDTFNTLTSGAACMEGVATLADQNSYKYRNCIVDNYPEGRRKHAVNMAKTSRKFNLVSANQNGALSHDAIADIACMFEIIDMIDKLAREGVTMMRLNENQSVYYALKETTKLLRRKEVISSYNAPILKVV